MLLSLPLDILQDIFRSLAQYGDGLISLGKVSCTNRSLSSFQWTIGDASFGIWSIPRGLLLYAKRTQPQMWVISLDTKAYISLPVVPTIQEQQRDVYKTYEQDTWNMLIKGVSGNVSTEIYSAYYHKITNNMLWGLQIKCLKRHMSLEWLRNNHLHLHDIDHVVWFCRQFKCNHHSHSDYCDLTNIVDLQIPDFKTMRHHGLSSEDVSTFSRFLSHHLGGITSLAIEANMIEDCVIHDVVKKTQLKYLSIANNKVTHSGVTTICKNLKFLEFFDFSHNPVDIRGFVAIGHHLQQHTSLTRLSFRGDYLFKDLVVILVALSTSSPRNIHLISETTGSECVSTYLFQMAIDWYKRTSFSPIIEWSWKFGVVPNCTCKINGNQLEMFDLSFELKTLHSISGPYISNELISAATDWLALRVEDDADKQDEHEDDNLEQDRISDASNAFALNAECVVKCYKNPHRERDRHMWQWYDFECPKCKFVWPAFSITVSTRQTLVSECKNSKVPCNKSKFNFLMKSTHKMGTNKQHLYIRESAHSALTPNASDVKQLWDRFGLLLARFPDNNTFTEQCFKPLQGPPHGLKIQTNFPNVKLRLSQPLALGLVPPS